MTRFSLGSPFRLLRNLLRGPPLGHSPREPETGLLPDNPAEQAFARWAWAGARIAFVWIALAFALYLSGALPAQVPIVQVERLFHEPVEAFLRDTGAPHGWGWLRHVDHGDTLSLAGLAFTLLAVVLAFLAAGWVFLRQRDWLYAGLVLLQVLVFVYAAFGR